MAARTYTKSRTGCKTCRRRKVKCDETRPICINCSRREIECLWGEPPINQHSFAHPRIHAGPSSLPPIFASTSLDLKGIELMHQYTTSTCFTICEDPVASDVWRLTIPRLAVMIENKPLLDSLLAVAALHLYTLNSTHPWATKYATAAVSYFNDALRASEADVGHRGMDSGAHFCSQMFIAIYGFASSASVYTPSPWLTVLRTSAATFRSRLSGLQFSESSVAGLIPWITAPLDLGGPSEDAARRFPPSLATLPLPVDGAPQISEVLDTSISAAYQHSLCFLRRSWAASFCRDYHVHAAFLWLMLSSDAFMALLAQRRPRALILLGHYCAAMDRSNGPWWMQKDWKSELLSISSGLDPQWAVWMNWE